VGGIVNGTSACVEACLMQRCLSCPGHVRQPFPAGRHNIAAEHSKPAVLLLWRAGCMCL
jgi:hypothetical protein